MNDLRRRFRSLFVADMTWFTDYFPHFFRDPDGDLYRATLYVRGRKAGVVFAPTMTSLLDRIREYSNENERPPHTGKEETQ